MQLERIKDEASRRLAQLRDQIDQLKQTVKSLKDKLPTNLPVVRSAKAESTRSPAPPLSPMAVLGSVERLLEEMSRQLMMPLGLRGGLWPRVDLVHKDKEIVVKADLPGVDPKEIQITVVGNQLVIRGSKQARYSTSDSGLLVSECFYGAFERWVGLPAEVELDKAEAAYSDGVLTIRLPLAKAQAQKPVKVKVKAG